MLIIASRISIYKYERYLKPTVFICSNIHVKLEKGLHKNALKIA